MVEMRTEPDLGWALCVTRDGRGVHSHSGAEVLGTLGLGFTARTGRGEEGLQWEAGPQGVLCKVYCGRRGLRLYPS